MKNPGHENARNVAPHPLRIFWLSILLTLVLAIIVGWLEGPLGVSGLGDMQWLMVEGGAATARAFLAADLVDTMMLYRAPHRVGGEGAALPELAEDRIGPGWRRIASHPLGSDRLDVYDRARCSPA